ncbi:MAG TPA: tRNA dihydrouridine synthase DusB [Gammaproteobacteria bacterium]|nr:tRNA dihydrouridine synthase DusB [Gammaproteobacteria bacterium]
MKIGSIALDNNLILAPMAGITDRPFRQLCRKLGAGLALSEMVTSDMRLWNSRKSRTRLDHRGEQSPRAVQIAGAVPAMMAEAARVNVDNGAELIDINMGCPAKKVCNMLAGSALLRNEMLVAKILEAVVSAVPVPVTLKIRTGWDKDNRNALSVAVLAEQSGIQLLTVHGRTRACGFSGEAEHETVAAIKSRVKIPVIANGDINSPQKAAMVLQETAADGIMIGRAAQGNPWIFREVYYYLHTGRILAPPKSEEVAGVLLDHLDGLYQLYGEYTGIRVARKHVGWYCKDRPGAKLFRDAFNQANTVERQSRLIEQYFIQQKQHDLAA